MTTNERAEMVPVSGEARMFFAPVARATDTPTVFDPSQGVDVDVPTVPWVDLGWVEKVKRSATTKMGVVRTGKSAAARVQYRLESEARLSVDFREWGKLQMALAASTQHLNVLASDGATTAGAGGHAVAAITIGAASTAQAIALDAASAAQFAAGDLVVVDVDYVSQSGYLGTGVSGAVVSSAASVSYDADYVRRVSFNVGRVASVASNTLQLEQPLVGGVPVAGAKVQKVVAFVDREGASFFQEWSALVVYPQKTGGMVCFYYPRLQSAKPAEETVNEVEHDVRSAALHAEFVALPVTDTLDGEQGVCYRSYFPAKTAEVY